MSNWKLELNNEFRQFDYETISDLHRSKGSEITNTALLGSLVNDNDKYTSIESPKIKSPEIIVVSVDVIRGSSKATTLS